MMKISSSIMMIMMIIIVSFVSLSSSSSSSSHGTVNADAIRRNKIKLQKRRAREEARLRYVEDNAIVFDSYGRVMRWPREPTKFSCNEDNNKIFKCKVLSFEERKYRNTEEEILQSKIRLDKQAEIDREAGSESTQDKANRRRKIENRKRCKLYLHWLEKYTTTSSDEKQNLYAFLSSLFSHLSFLISHVSSPPPRSLSIYLSPSLSSQLQMVRIRVCGFRETSKSSPH